MTAEWDVVSSPRAPSHQGLSECALPSGGQQTHFSVTQGLTLEGWDIRNPSICPSLSPTDSAGWDQWGD